jgi:hypothetical protein
VTCCALWTALRLNPAPYETFPTSSSRRGEVLRERVTNLYKMASGIPA